MSANNRQKFEREFRIEKQYLNFPVKQGASGRLIRLICDGKAIREFEVSLAINKPDFWVFLDVSEFKGKTVISWLQVNG